MRFPRLRRAVHALMGTHLDRIVMDDQLRHLVATLDYRRLSVLEISGRKWDGFGFGAYRALDYPDFDITAPLTLPDRFDLVIAEQVFEHLAYPARAARNVCALLHPGGHFLVSTPFLQKIHEHPIDCTRWTETGLRYFLADNGFDLTTITTGAWGNKWAARANLRSRTRFPRRRAFWGPMRHDPVFPVQVWALAQRGADGT
jgi:SAM-dependent methyltransferase